MTHCPQILNLLKARVVSWVIKKYLKDYLEIDERKIEKWDGILELNDVLIKKNAFKGTTVPVEVQYGCIGAIRMKISWFNLKNEPSFLEIEDVSVILR